MYIRKSSPVRDAVIQQEVISTIEGETVVSKPIEYILPSISQSSELKGKSMYAATWEEELLINESFSYLLSPNVIMLIEVVDINTPRTKRSSPLSPDDAWMQIAWAFFSFMGSNDMKNTGKMVRLQLYKYRKKKIYISHNAEVPSVFLQWRRLPHKLYSSTIYLTVRGRVRPPHLQLNKTHLVTQSGAKNEGTSFANHHMLSKKIRYVIKHKLESSTKGCFVVQYSNQGKLLAAACADIFSLQC